MISFCNIMDTLKYQYCNLRMLVYEVNVVIKTHRMDKM